MKPEERLRLLLTATPVQLASVDSALAGQYPSAQHSMRLLRIGEAAKMTGLSRVTLWRLCREGHLRTVKVRKGSHRIPESVLRDLVEGHSPPISESGQATGCTTSTDREGGANA